MHIAKAIRPRTNPIRVLHLVSTFAIKTDTKWLLQIARHLDRRRFRMTAACFFGGGPIMAELQALGVETHNFDAPGEHDPRAIFRAKRLIESGDFDVVHTHLLRADLYGGLAARCAGAPAVVSTAYAIGAFQRAKRRRLDWLLDAVHPRIPSHFLAVCDAVRDDLVTRLHVPPERITVIRTGINPPPAVPARSVSAARKRWAVPSNAPLVLTVARLSYEKGIDDLVNAAAVVHRTSPGVRFVVLGEGPDRADLENRIARLDLRNTIKLAGFTPDVWSALAAADVFCLPSKSEGMPNALLEAMAASRAVVATAVGGVPEAIVDSHNGLLVPAGDSMALAAALHRAIGDRRLRDRLGAAARRTVEFHFLARDVVEQYGRLYEQLRTEGKEAHAGLLVEN